MAKEIEVIIGNAGEIQIEGKGFKGESCEKATRFLEKALGLLKLRKDKPERWQRDNQTCQSVGR